MEDVIGLPWVDPASPWNTIDVGKGWLDIISQLHEDLAKMDPDYKLFQVKEKFAGLRYYISTEASEAVSNAMYERIGRAEDEAERTCEECGEAGHARTDIGWLRTLCDTDYLKAKQARQAYEQGAKDVHLL